MAPHARAVQAWTRTRFLARRSDPQPGNLYWDDRYAGSSGNYMDASEDVKELYWVDRYAGSAGN